MEKEPNSEISSIGQLISRISPKEFWAFLMAFVGIVTGTFVLGYQFSSWQAGVTSTAIIDRDNTIEKLEKKIVYCEAKDVIVRKWALREITPSAENRRILKEAISAWDSTKEQEHGFQIIDVTQGLDGNTIVKFLGDETSLVIDSEFVEDAEEEEE